MDWAPLACGLLAFLLYANTLQSGFVYDDNRAILSNEDVRPDTPLINLLFDDFWGTPLTHSGSHKSYRPLTVLSFRLNYGISGLHPGTYHLLNVLLHAFTTAIYTACVRLIFRESLQAWLAGLLFASHPIHTEAVAGLVGRADVGATMFFLLTLLCYHGHVKYRDKTQSNERTATRDMFKCRCFLVASIILGACAMLTKEQGISVFPVCVLYDLFVCNRYKPHELLQWFRNCFKLKGVRSNVCGKRNINVHTSVTSIILSFSFLIALRAYVMGGRLPSFAAADNPASHSSSLLTRTLTFLYLPVFNFGLLLCPSTLSFDWSMGSIPLVEGVLDPRNLLSVSFYSAFAVTLYKTVSSMNSDNSGDVFVDANDNKCCTKSGASPKRCRVVLGKNQGGCGASDDAGGCSCQTEGLKSVITADQRRDLDALIMSTAFLIFPYLPASNLVAYVGFVVAERILYLPSLGYCLLVATGINGLFKCCRGHERKLVIFATAVLLVSFSTKTYYRNQDWYDEESLYRSGIEVNPPKAYGNLGNILNLKGNYEEAEKSYLRALNHRPNMADVHYNLGVLLQNQQRYEEAVQRYRVAIQCRPRLAVAYLNLGIVLARLGRTEEALQVLRSGSRLDGTGLKDPRTHETAKVAALFHLGRLLMDQGRLEDALAVFQEAVDSMPNHYQPQSVFNMLGEVYSRLGQDEKAEPWFKAALATKPDHIPAHLTYGKLLARNKTRIREAELWYQKALRMAPNDPSVLRHYGQFLSSQERHLQAAEKFKQAANMVSKEYEDVVSAATSLRLAGKLKEAEVYYKMAVRLRPQDPSSYVNLGALFHLTGRLRDAEECYQRAIKLRPDDHVTQVNLQRLHNLMTSKAEKQRAK